MVNTYRVHFTDGTSTVVENVSTRTDAEYSAKNTHPDKTISRTSECIK